MSKIGTAVTALVMVGALGGCGADEEPTAEDTTTTETGSEDTDSSEEAPSDDEGDISSGGGGTLTLGGESISLDEVLCYLQEQDAAAGGGKILFVVQGTGTDAAGEDVMVDVSRYDEDSQFSGDSIDVSVGDIMSGEAAGYSAIAETGTVTLDGSTARADGVVLRSDEDGSEVETSFEITC